jgi:hypothetical protein
MKSLLPLFFILFAIAAVAQTPAQIETELLGQLENIAKFGSYSGNFDEDKVSSGNEQIRQILVKNGARKEVLAYAFPKLKGEMFVATSPDGRLRIYSWDLQTGGTMHDFANVYQYQGKSGKVHTWTEEDGDESAGAFYTEIFQTASKTGTIYLAASTFIGSTSAHGQSIRALRISSEKLEPNAKVIRTARGLTDSVGFAYDFFTVVDRPERPVKLFEFNEAKKEFSFPVVIEDSETPQGRVTKDLIRYRFNGTHFIKVK